MYDLVLLDTKKYLILNENFFIKKEYIRNIEYYFDLDLEFFFNESVFISGETDLGFLKLKYENVVEKKIKKKLKTPSK